MEYLKLDQLKKFVGVQFLQYGKSNDVIPRCWLQQNDANFKAQWPAKNAKFKSKQNVFPEKTWKFYSVKILCHSSTYKCFIFNNTQ